MQSARVHFEVNVSTLRQLDCLATYFNLHELQADAKSKTRLLFAKLQVAEGPSVWSARHVRFETICTEVRKEGKGAPGSIPAVHTLRPDTLLAPTDHRGFTPHTDLVRGALPSCAMSLIYAIIAGVCLPGAVISCGECGRAAKVKDRAERLWRSHRMVPYTMLSCH